MSLRVRWDATLVTIMRLKHKYCRPTLVEVQCVELCVLYSLQQSIKQFKFLVLNIAP